MCRVLFVVAHVFIVVVVVVAVVFVAVVVVLVVVVVAVVRSPFLRYPESQKHPKCIIFGSPRIPETYKKRPGVRPKTIEMRPKVPPTPLRLTRAASGPTRAPKAEKRGTPATPLFKYFL